MRVGLPCRRDALPQVSAGRDPGFLKASLANCGLGAGGAGCGGRDSFGDFKGRQVRVSDHPRRLFLTEPCATSTIVMRPEEPP